jgi:histidine ammonia-lyase
LTTDSSRRCPPADGEPLVIGSRSLTIDDVISVSEGLRPVVLEGDPAYRALLDRSTASLHEQVRRGKVIYGVTTGVGASCTNAVSSGLIDAFPPNLVRFHGCGTGAPLNEQEAAAVMVARLASLARGYSAVRPIVLERICELLNAGALPVIPGEGSVGASGDLTPLSYLAAVLLGEREVTFSGKLRPAAAVLSELGLEPLVLAPKESLALMNGTSAMTGLACLAHHRAVRLAKLGCAVTALMSEALRGHRYHFDRRIFDLKPHPGQSLAATWIREHLEADESEAAPSGAVQDRYSIRCAPHVMGVLVDALSFSRGIIEIELNGVNDNPIILSDPPDVLHGGNFYGGHIALAMDTLKVAIASVADLLDRQVALICNPQTNNGLPGDLVMVKGAEAAIHHGFKAMQITASALAAEALRSATPASIFSRSTESHNQDKVSMGTIAARDCLRIVELTETVGAIALLAACQGRDLREEGRVRRTPQPVYEAVRRRVAPNDGDRRQDVDIQTILELLRSDMLRLDHTSGGRRP